MMPLCVMTQINYERIHFSICECIFLARARPVAAKMSQNAYNYGRIEPPPANPRQWTKTTMVLADTMQWKLNNGSHVHLGARRRSLARAGREQNRRLWARKWVIFCPCVRCRCRRPPASGCYCERLMNCPGRDRRSAGSSSTPRWSRNKINNTRKSGVGKDSIFCVGHN